MIVYLEGNLLSAKPLYAVVLVGGVGYGVNIPLRTNDALPRVGEPVQLFIRQVFREDAADLYGFHEESDRDFFDLLTRHVSGIGPKTAITLMSRIGPSTLRQAIADGDTGLLAKCPGIGKKTAERLVVELRDKIGLPAAGGGEAALSSFGAVSSGNQNSINRGEAVAALLALGYKLPEADRAVEKALGQLGADASTEDLIKQSLR